MAIENSNVRIRMFEGREGVFKLSITMLDQNFGPRMRFGGCGLIYKQH